MKFTFIKESKPPIGGEYIVIWKLDDGGYPTTTSMDYDIKSDTWSDPRGVYGIDKSNEIIAWMDMPEPPDNIDPALWKDDSDHFPYTPQTLDEFERIGIGQCIHGEKFVNCQKCKTDKQ